MPARKVIVAAAVATALALSAVASAGTTYKAKNTLKLEGHLEAIVKLSRSSPDLYPITCTINRKVKVQRKSEGLWRNVVTGLTNGSGRFSADIPDKAGKYRSVAPQKTSGSTTCTKTVSDVVTHSHA